MTSEPHTQRCETCSYREVAGAYTERNGNLEKIVWCKHPTLIVQQINNKINFIEEMGCASHSSATSAEQVLDEAINEIEMMIDLLESAIPDISFFRLVEDRKLTVGAYKNVIAVLEKLHQQQEKGA